MTQFILNTSTHKIKTSGKLIKPEDIKAWVITSTAFIARISPEYAALDIASIDNPQAAMNERVQAAELRKFFELVRSSPFVDLKSKVSRDAMQGLTGAGFFTQERHDEIMLTPASQEEEY